MIFNMKKIAEWFVEAGWSNQVYDDIDINMSDLPFSRYVKVPISFMNYLKFFRIAESSDSKSWFILYDDFMSNQESGLRWNEFEIISFDSAEGDEEWISEIRDFWDRYLPFVISVRNGYEYWAIDTHSVEGTIVNGCEPEFENATEVAESFEDFFDGLIQGNIFI